MSIPSYPSPKHLGDRHITGLLPGPVVVQEKVDGSQISFGVDTDGKLRIRSRGGPVAWNTADKLFAPACAAIVAVKDRLPPGHVFRGEEIRNALYALYRKQFASIFVKGLPEWYKGKLVEKVKESLSDS